MHCCGGFVVIHVYGVARTTNDCDFISIIPSPLRREILTLAGEGSQLHKRYKVRLDAVTVATFPCDYQERMAPISPGSWKHLQLFALEAHDLALTKIERNSNRDLDDVRLLARAGHLDRDVLRSRYHDELRPYLLSREQWHDGTLDMWIQSFWDD